MSELRNMTVGIAFRDDATAGINRVNSMMDSLASGFGGMSGLAMSASSGMNIFGQTGASALNDVVGGADDVTGALGHVFDSISDVDDGLSSLNSAPLNTAEDSAGDLSGALDETTGGLRDIESGLDDINSRNIDDMTDSTDDLSDALDDATDNVDDLGDASTSASNTMLLNFSNVGGGLKKLGGLISKFVVLPLVGAGTAAFKFAVDQEAAFAQVSTLLDKSSTDFGAYKSDIRALSSEMGIAFEDVAESVYSSISAGQDQADAIEFTRKATMLAAGGFTDTAKAVDVMTTALNAYGLESSEAGSISDMLITTQNLGKTTVDELSASMGAVIPIAQAQGVEFDQLAAGYAVLTKNGVATAEAGTGLKAMLGELGKSGSKVDKILRKKTGKSFSELSAAGLNTGDVLGVLQQEADKSGLKLSDMFGSVLAGGSALTLAQDNGAEFQEFLGGMGDSAGATEKAFKIMTDTVSDKMSVAWTTLKNTGVSMVESTLPIVGGLLDKIGEIDVEKVVEKFKAFGGYMADTFGPILSNLKSDFTEMKDSLQTSFESGALKDAFDGLKDGMSWISDNWPVIKDTIIGVGVAVLTFKGIMGGMAVIGTVNTLMAAYRSGTLVATAAQMGLNLAMLASPMTWVVIGIAAVIAIGVLLWRNWDTVKLKASELWEVIKEKWTALQMWTSEVWGGVKTGISEAMENAKTSVSNFFSPLTTFIDSVKEKWDNLVGAFKNFKMPEIKFPDMPKVGLPKWAGGNGLIQTDGSHATGLASVPRDGYMAELHKDESVLTAQQSNSLRSMGILGNQGNLPVLNLPKKNDSPPDSPTSPTEPQASSTITKTENNNVFNFNISGENAKDIAAEVRREVEAIFSRLNAVTP